MPLYLSKNRPVVLITMGDPSGVGPEVILKAMASPKINRLANFFVIGDAFVLETTRRRLNLPKEDFAFNLVNMCNVPAKRFSFGKIDARYGRAAVDYIRQAVYLIKDSRARTLVTAPINKESARLSGFKWPGHTEFLAHLAGTEKFCMMLAGGPLRVVLATTHIGISKVIRTLRKEKIVDAIVLTAVALREYFDLKIPRIAVCSLNPHSGEGGLFGDEERRIIIPAIKEARRKVKNVSVSGPIASDAIFYDAYRGRFDAEIVMYHDQGLIPLKMISKDTAVNVTLGLPFVRTSPAHGTAFDIAGKNVANPSSMIEAIKLAIKMAG